MAEYQHYRKIVEQKISLALNQGGWEGAHNDFKLELQDDRASLSKLIKHILAFANTPRKEEAFIIFGVREVDAFHFKHEGAINFPKADKIYSIIKANTNIGVNDVLIDDQFTLNGIWTPYVVVHQAYEGPYKATNTLGTNIVQRDAVYIRYGRSSERATIRDINRMKDWAGWAIDLRYASSKNELRNIIEKYFPDNRDLTVHESYIKFVYSHMETDFGGSYKHNVLVHAYEGVRPINRTAIDFIEKDNAYGSAMKTIIGPQFTFDLLDEAEKKNIRCIKIEDIFLKNDPYASYCKAFLQYWKGYCKDMGITRVIDLDYEVGQERKASIAAFLDSSLRENKGLTVVSGDFGTGKSITAKYFTAELMKDYLRKVEDTPKVIFVDLHNYDIRTKTQDILSYELIVKCGIQRPEADKLICMYEKNQIHPVFDSVDEMAKPHNLKGRQEVLDTLTKICNEASSIFFVRSAYFPSDAELKKFFERIAPYDYLNNTRLFDVINICDLDDEQIDELLLSRIENKDALSALNDMRKGEFKKILRDPLIVSLVSEYIEEVSKNIGEAENSETLMDKNYFLRLLQYEPKVGRIAFLNYLIAGLLERERIKRRRHRTSQIFDIFSDCLYEIAFNMICEERDSFSIQRWNEIITGHLNIKNITDYSDEAVDAFRTMAWIHRDDRTGEVKFRNELLTLVCAAKFIINTLRTYGQDVNMLELLNRWNSESSLASTVIAYTDSLLEDKDIILIASVLEKNTLAVINKLLLDILKNISSLDDLRSTCGEIEDSRVLGKLGGCLIKYPTTAKHIIPLVAKRTKSKRCAQFFFPLLVELSSEYEYGRADKVDILRAAEIVISHLYEITQEWKGKYCDDIKDIGDHIKCIKKMDREFYDKLLLKELGVTQASIVAAESYYKLFEALCPSSVVGADYDKRYTMRSFEWISNKAKSHPH